MCYVTQNYFKNDEKMSDFTMADQVDSMSDAELRTKLAEHGFPVMPITASTRNLLVKKLKLVLDNKSKPRNSVDNKVESRRTLAQYSSGEESDLDTTNNAKERRGRRATTGGAMLPPVTNKTKRQPPPKKGSPAKRDSDKGSESEEEKSPVRTHEEVETVTTRRVTRTYAANDQDDYETGSDSDVDSGKTKKTSSPFRSSSRSSDYISSTLPTVDAATSPPKTSIFSRPSISPGFSSSLSSSDHLNSIRSRLGLTSTLGDRPSSSTYTPNFTPAFQPSTSNVDEIESPYLSNFTRRLSALKADPKPTSFIDRDANNGTTVLPRRSYITGVSRSDVVDYKTANDRKFLKNNLVSLTLVVLVALFFFCLFFMYIVKKNDITSVVDDQNSLIPICQLNIPGNRPGINCVPKEQVSYAKDLLKVIHPELTSRAAAFKCSKPGALPYLTEREIIDIANAKAGSVDISQCRTDLNNLQVLIVNNPRWGLSVVQLKNLYTKDADYVPITTTDAVVQQRNKGSVALVLSDPSTPITCLLVNTMYSAGSTLIVVGVMSLLLLGLQRAYKYYVTYQKRKSEEVYSMVEQIIQVISQETEDSGEPYISVDHVRDTLISPQNREKMSSVWDAAVKFIQRNESRVRMEVQSVDGEDCRVWRWISHNSPKRTAAWQGQAFETQEGSVNNLTVSPTPCLKIRNMFDKNDANPNLRSVIQEAIVEKCGDVCNILHVDIERTSCCVYVKCASPSDAGVVYRSLHGWWYEGRLITVKYLHLERYMQRFPNSPSIGPYLKSNRQRRSNWEE
ncbi:inner nuclear membrane protein Man1-like isoform X1 [Ostrinia nubilalis]|uniref:inner nuclear membrane protein Man1-like isoform X1 n=2 Tax=Ostrinia nubilalis TaxID=29057 RepID=UPI0030824C06